MLFKNAIPYQNLDVLCCFIVKDSCHLHTSETAFSRNGLNTLSDTWRTWSIQRSGFPDTEFEGTVIYRLWTVPLLGCYSQLHLIILDFYLLVKIIFLFSWRN